MSVLDDRAALQGAARRVTAPGPAENAGSERRADASGEQKAGEQKAAEQKPGETKPEHAKGTTTAPNEAVAEKPDPMIGTVIAGRYRIEARLGEGGMGSVYRVEHTHMRKKLALKVLHKEMTAQPEIVARFEREAMAAAHIEHPNVAGATDFGKLEDGSCYLVLEYVEGTSLRALIDKGPIQAARAVHIIVQILAGLKIAHDLGIVHRDLKPENVLLVDREGESDFVKILDFGIARVPIGAIGGDVGPSLTRAGMVYGTPEYMAPEQALGQDVDGRSDQYAVGVMLFEMLAGKRPYDNKDKVALLGQHVAGPIPSVRSRAPDETIPGALEIALTRMLSKSPSDRFPDAATAAESLFLAGTGAIPSLPPPARDAEFPPGTIPMDSFSRHDTGNDLTIPPPASLGFRSDGSAIDLHKPTPTPGPTSVLARAPKRALALVGAGAAMLLVLLVVMLVRKPSGDEVVAGAEGVKNGTPTAPTSPTSQLSADSKAKVQSALGKVTAGDIEGGIKELEALSLEHPNDIAVLKALAQAYQKGKRHLDALGVVKQLVVAYPEAATDPTLDSLFDDALAGPPAVVDGAFALLEGPMKAQGARVLYAIAFEGRGPDKLAPRARKSLADPEVQKVTPASVKGVLELRNAPHTCGAKREVIEKYKSDFDASALPVLKAYLKTTGCGGFFKRGDCFACLRPDDFLGKVIAAVEERSKK